MHSQRYFQLKVQVFTLTIKVTTATRLQTLKMSQEHLNL